jgi:hypothetical protein
VLTHTQPSTQCSPAARTAMSYDEVEIEDMAWDEALRAFTYQVSVCAGRDRAEGAGLMPWRCRAHTSTVIR